VLGICKITGAALREFRKEQGLTIQEFADSVGYKFRAMANIETGSSPIPLKLHIQIEKVYGVEFLHILNRIDFTGLTELEKGELVEYIEDIKIKQEKAYKKSICKLEKEIAKTVQKATKLPLYEKYIFSDDEIEELKEYADKLIRAKIEEFKNNSSKGV